MKPIKLYGLLLTVILGATSCDRDEDSNPAFTADLIVVNEGNYSTADGSVTGYNYDTKEVKNKLFDDANGFAIGSIIQSISGFNNKFYIIGNSTDQLLVIDGDDYTLKATINSGLATPYRFVTQGDKGYISNWGTANPDFTYSDPFIAIVDLESNTIENKIQRAARPQDVLIKDDNLYISNVGGNTISVIDISTEEQIANIETADFPDDMEIDKNGMIWVICSSGTLMQIDPSKNEVTKTIENIPVQGFNEKMVINNSGDKLYFINGTGLYELAIEDTTGPAVPLIEGETLYGLGVDDDVIFVGEANNYSGPGTVLMYDLTGKPLGSFDTGFLPNGFIFDWNE